MSIAMPVLIEMMRMMAVVVKLVVVIGRALISIRAKVRVVRLQSEGKI